MIKQISLVGDHYAMGWQHGRQVQDFRPRILEAIKNRLTALQEVEVNVQPFLEEIYSAWDETGRPVMDMLHGIADALQMDWEHFFQYTVATYLLDQARQPSRGARDCTVWAAAQPAMSDGGSILVKNRDYWYDHQDLQCFARAQPKSGYRYAYLTSAGSAGVFSSGMNEAGLAVADTHVVSLNIGPGLPRYAVMMQILEHYEQVGQALEYIQSIRHAGNGTLVLADAYGDLAVVETGYTIQGVLLPKNGMVVSTNHFVSSELNDLWLERRRRKELHGDSLMRYARVKRNLRTAHGAVDLNWAKELMSSHGGRMNAICRHREDDPRYVTISSVIYLPVSRQIYLSNGMPCQTPYEIFSVVNDG